MEYGKKMSNVSFGGNWSEELIEAEKARDILLNFEWAISNCIEKDVNTEAMQEALEYVRLNADKGAMLVERWQKGHSIELPELRRAHFKDTLQLILDQMGL